jgi:hypothetical protein
MRMSRVVAVLVSGAVGVLGAGCGEDRAPTGGSAGSSGSAASATPEGAQRYEVSATVLESADHGPQLCAGGTLLSLPPQCGGPDIIGWDWGAVADETTNAGTTWGEYRIVGTYDGTSFTLTEVPGPPGPPPAAPPMDFSTPCPAPPGGWAVVDESKVTFEDYQRFSEALQTPPDYAGSWVDESTNTKGTAGDPMNAVFTVAYTGDLDRHRAELRELWGGPVCVIQRSRTEASLRVVLQDLSGERGRALGVDVLDGSVDDVRNIVTCRVFVADTSLQQRVDETYGEGIVELTGALQPVS